MRAPSLWSGLAALALTSCIMPPVGAYGGVEPAIIAMDSLSIAYEMGRRDALRTHWLRSPSSLTTLALPISLVALLRTGEWWAYPATVSVLTSGVALYARRDTKRPAPEPAASQREWYRLSSDEAWRRYRLGYRDAIEERRRAELVRTANTAAIMTLSSLVLWYALRPPSYR